jgi:hypothetical protein
MAPNMKRPKADRLAPKNHRRGNALDRDKIDKIIQRIAALPVADERSPNELIGYDQAGLPGRCCSRARTSPRPT